MNNSLIKKSTRSFLAIVVVGFFTKTKISWQLRIENFMYKISEGYNINFYIEEAV